ncbi:MAG: chemotaxis protein CheW [Gammaproteobacteria bacterium]|nr:chemotaxis protein CheW [Gammaproteobacteria bacterium]
MQDKSPFQLLAEIRRKATELAGQGLSYLSQSAGVKNIAFKVNDINFYSAARDVREVSVCDKLMLVPQTKNWMRGLVNSKGILYSVNDLSLLAGFDRPVQISKGHLLLLSDQDSQSALLVNRVIGFRYFDESQRLPDIDSKLDVLDGLSSYVQEGYHADGRDWFHLDVSRLLASEQFREIQ